MGVVGGTSDDMRAYATNTSAESVRRVSEAKNGNSRFCPLSVRAGRGRRSVVRANANSFAVQLLLNLDLEVEVIAQWFGFS